MYDFHTHFIPPEVITWLKDHKKTVNAKWIKKDENKNDILIVNEKWGFEVKKAFIDGSLYLAEQEKAGVTHSLLSPIPQLFMYDFPEEITMDISSVYNQTLAQWTKLTPKETISIRYCPSYQP